MGAAVPSIDCVANLIADVAYTKKNITFVKF